MSGILGGKVSVAVTFQGVQKARFVLHVKRFCYLCTQIEVIMETLVNRSSVLVLGQAKRNKFRGPFARQKQIKA